MRRGSLAGGCTSFERDVIVSLDLNGLEESEIRHAGGKAFLDI